MKIDTIATMKAQTTGMREALQTEYWTLHKKLAETSFQSRQDQTTGMILQGKVLEAMIKLDEASQALTDLHRYSRAEKAQRVQAAMMEDDQ